MGEVYLAEDTRLSRLVAIKFLPAALTNDASRLRRFEQEARAISALNHPNIVTIYEIGEAEVGRFIVLEYVKGQTLRSVVGGRRGLESIVPIGRQVATALGVAHDAGMIHRDIKPENVMVRDDGYVKVLDFGLARLGGADVANDSTADTDIQTKPGTLIGTVAYMSPEQIKGETVASASDVFSLGVVFYEMATGRKPFHTGSEVSLMYHIVHGDAAPPGSVNPEVPRSIDTLILRMIEKDPRMRPTAAEVVAALNGDDPVSQASLSAASAPSIGSGARGTTVGRAAERAKLRAAFETAGAGRGMMQCVTGEAGLGKTTLVEEVLAEIQQANPASRIARGRCSERLAGAEAYLPFLEALDSLIRASPALARVMKADAPSWYVQLAASHDGSVERLIREAPAVSQERMKRELSIFLQEVSASNPLVLFFDDLHWADTSTVDILAYVGTKLASMPLFIVAAYRSSEMRLRTHPFLPVALELQARGVCQELPLGFLTADDIETYLDLEFRGHGFPRAFASLLFAKTEGNPLFMTDVVRDLRDSKVIDKDAGRWALVRSVPEIENDLPETVRSMIQRKVAQLGDSDRRLLVAASAQGYSFDSAVLARALAIDPGDVEERLQALDQTYGFVKYSKEDELPDQTLTLRYRFVHVLYQNALYATLTPSRRASLSAAIAGALVAFHGDKSATIAAELAFLYQAARDWPRASEHFLKAARNAARIFANQEAIALCRRGLDMTRRTPDSSERARQELKLQMTLGPSLMTVKGFAATETLQTHVRAEALAEQLGDDAQLFRVLFGLAIVSVVRAEYGKARRYAERCLEQAERAGDAALLVQAHWVLGLSLQYMGDLVESRRHLERSIALYDPVKHATHVFLYGAILNRAHLARVLLYLGHPDEAHTLVAESVAASEKMRHPVGLCNALSVAVTLEAFHGNTERILEMTTAMIFHADEHGLPYYAGLATIMRGWALAMEGQVDEGIAEMTAGLAAHRSVETEQQRAYYLVLMAEALCEADRFDESERALDEAAATIEKTDERLCEAELYRIRGEVLAKRWQSEAAKAAFERAIVIARAQHARAFEVRAARSLAALRR